MDDRGPQPPLRGVPPKEPLDRPVAEMARDSGAGATDRGVEVVAEAGDEPRRVRDTQEGAKQEDSAESLPQTVQEIIAERLADAARMLRRTSYQLGEEQQHGFAGLIHDAADRLDDLGGELLERDVSSMLDQARDFTRKQPGLALGGSVVAGLLLFQMLSRSSGRSRTDRQPEED